MSEEITNNDIEVLVDIRAVAKDILQIDIHKDKPVSECINEFYRVMEKHVICQGDKIGDGSGRSINTPEWAMCKDFFMARIHSKFQFFDVLDDVPEDIQVYK